MLSSDDSSSASSEGPKRGIKRKRGAAPTSSAKSGKTAAQVKAQGAVSAGGSLNDSDTGADSEETDSDREAGGDTPLEVEVLSHAAQRKLKKKAQKETSSESSSQQPATDELKKRKNSIWVGNLAFKTSEQALRAFFQRGVPGCEVTRVHLPKKNVQDVASKRGGMRGENCGFAYVDFATKDEKEKAIALSEQHLDGRKLLIKDGDDFTGRPTAATSIPPSAVGKSKTAQRILAVQKQPPAPTLFLGNLGFQATEQSIREMIEGHMRSRKKGVTGTDAGGGNANDKVLKKVRLGTFEDSGLCKGFAFVDFTTTEDATEVLLDPRNHRLDGRNLVVEYASADAVRRGGGPGAKSHRLTQESRGKGENGDGQLGKSRSGDHKSKERSTRESADVAQEEGSAPPPKKQKREENKRHDGEGKKRRTKPGAALALAQREKVAIVLSSGKKTVF